MGRGIYVILTLTNSACGIVTDSDNISISSDVIPEVHIHPDAADTVTCPGSPFPFFYDEGLSVFWDFGEGTVTNDPYPIFQYDSVGNYTVTITVTNECGNTNMIDTTIVVDSALSPQHSIHASTTTVCPDDTVSFRPIAVQGYSFVWDFDNGDSAIGDNVITSFSDTGTYVVSLIAQNNCGNTAIATRNIEVVDSLGPVGSIFISDKLVCPNEAIKFVCTKKNAGYLWKFGNGDSATTKSAVHIYEFAGSYPIELTITNMISFNYANTKLMNHYWNFGDGNTDSVANPLHSYADTGTFQVVHTVVNSCGKADTAITNIIIDNYGAATANFEALTGNWVCPATPITFNNFSSDTNNCIWHFDDGDSSTMANPVHTYTLPGNYLVRLQVTNSCGQSSTATRVVTVTNSAQLPAPVVTCSYDSLPVIFSWNAIQGALGYLVSEDSGSSWISNNGNSEDHYIAATWGVSYTLLVRAIGNITCPTGRISGTVECAIWDNIPEIEPVNEIVVFPNPASEKITIRLNLQSPVLVSAVISLFNSRGALVKKMQMTGASSDLNVQDLVPGIYLLRVETKSHSISKKVILIR